MFTAVDVIRTKRDGKTLSDEDIRLFIDGYVRGDIPDEQAAALLMAVVWRGLGAQELAAWTRAMIDSGQRLDLSRVRQPLVDKHSTGGVGDKISLPLCPLVASLGATVPQLSGRGLGHTGGTLDKLESIPGYRTDLSVEEFTRQLVEIGVAISAAGEALAPADRLLYALRDVTGTVESIPLIASSIMSKKIAEGTDALVLDVKVGDGAFMGDIESAQDLAHTMVGLGRAHGVRTTALITEMDTPLGRTVGNALEVAEATQVLEGGGPGDVRSLTLTLAEQMLALAGIDADPAHALDDGRAMDVWRAMVRAQDGDPDAPLPRALHVEHFTAKCDGFVTQIRARPVGVAAWKAGAGRSRKEDTVSAGAGVMLRATVGDRVTAGQVIAELHVDEPKRIVAAMPTLEGAITIDPDPRMLPSLTRIRDVISDDG